MSYIVLENEKVAFEISNSILYPYDAEETKLTMESIIDYAYDSDVLERTVHNLTLSDLTPILTTFIKATELDYDYLDKLLVSWFIENNYGFKIIPEYEFGSIRENYKVFYKNNEGIS